MSVVAIYVTFPSVAEATHIGQTVIDEKLAACINIFAPCTSIYRWQGAVEQSEEVPALIKTTSDAAATLIARLGELHSFETPAIAAWPIEQLPASFAKWVSENVPVI